MKRKPMLRASAEPAKRAAEKLVLYAKPSERIKQIAEGRARAQGFKQPQVSIGDLMKYLDEVSK